MTQEAEVEQELDITLPDEEATQEEIQEEVEQEIDPEMQKALDSGWKPQEEWDGDSDWIDYKEFNFRGELYDRIKSQTNKIRSQDQKLSELQQALQKLGEHNHKIAEMEYEKAVKDLKAQRREAMEMGDYETFDKLEEDLEELKGLKPEPVELNQSQQANVHVPELDAWRSQNPWYEKDPVMRGAADAVALDYVRKDPSAKADPERVLNHVTQEIRKKFPQEFSSRRSAPPRAVSEGTTTGNRSKSTNKYTEKHLTAEQKKMAKTFVEAGALKSVQEYVDQLAELGELEV